MDILHAAAPYTLKKYSAISADMEPLSTNTIDTPATVTAPAESTAQTDTTSQEKYTTTNVNAVIVDTVTIATATEATQEST